MPGADPQAARHFAVDVVCALRRAGYEALWAGGCVRDQLLGLEPKDYDVATNATPQQIRAVFGKRKTLAMGAAFGVVVVLGPRRAGQIEVATFRQDFGYSDGRRPDRVSFSDARQDAQRRDFTINGLFFDPRSERLIDYVDGERDLRSGLIRAIGDPHQRFSEDKLRMLRAVRFATVFSFRIDPDTFTAAIQHAEEISLVSVERITEELRRMLIHPQRRRAVELLQETRLLHQILPEATHTLGSAAGRETLDILETLDGPTVSVAVAALLRSFIKDESNPQRGAKICRRWKLSNEETEGVEFCLLREDLLRNAADIPWPQLQRVLTARRIHESLMFVEAVAQVVDGSVAQVDFCRRKLALPKQELDPVPLISGDDLRAAGVPPGPEYKRLLEEARDRQLTGDLRTKAAALQFALRSRSVDSDL